MSTKWRPTEGALLGFLRADDVIDHDNDYDYDVEYFETAYKFIVDYCLLKGCVLSRKVMVLSRVQQLCFFLPELIFLFSYFGIDRVRCIIIFLWNELFALCRLNSLIIWKYIVLLAMVEILVCPWIGGSG